MMSDLEKARLALSSGNATCVLCKGDIILTSFERGVKPLVAYYESGDDLRGFSAADKVVGKGAAFIYVLLGVRAVHACVISEPALALLQNEGISVEYDVKTEHIVNRKGDGFCPFEMAVMNIRDKQLAYTAIREKMKEMNITL